MDLDADDESRPGEEAVVPVGSDDVVVPVGFDDVVVPVGFDDAVVLVSFDIDGTLWAGDPPGPVALHVVQAVAARGCVIGSASDRPRSNQQELWDRHGVDVHFVGGKHHLPDVRERFDADRYVHIGDTDVDEHFARQAGFEFIWVDRLHEASGPWTL